MPKKPSKTVVAQLGTTLPKSGLSVHFRNNDPLGKDDRTWWLLNTLSADSDKRFNKYLKGIREHKCDIGDQSIEYLLEQINDEVIDLFFYVAELRRRIKDRKLV